MQQSEAMNRMVASRTALLLDYPFWGSLALKLKLKEDPTCKTAWVDGVTLGYNPEYVMELPTAAHVKGLIAHEVGHCALGHPWRRSGREKDKWNEAADRVTNPMLRDSGFTLPDNVLYELEPAHKGKSVEWVFNRLPKPTPNTGNEAQSGTGEPDQDTSETSEDTPQTPGEDQEESNPPSEDQDVTSESEEDQSSQSSTDSSDQEEDDTSQGGGEPSDDTSETSEDRSETPSDGQEGSNTTEEEEDATEPFGGEVRDAPPTTEEEDTDLPSEEEWKQAVRQAANMAQGSLPADVARVIKETTEPRVDWRSVLRRFIQEVSRSDYSWTRPNKRYIPGGLYLPALHNQEVGSMVIAVDTSGSIDDTLLRIFGAEVAGIVEEVQPRQVHVIYCDSRVQHIDVFERGEPVELQPHGGGGTNFIPVFEAMEKLDEPPTCLVYLTDLRGSFPQDDGGVETLWVAPKRYTQWQIPFGEVVPIEE